MGYSSSRADLREGQFRAPICGSHARLVHGLWSSNPVGAGSFENSPQPSATSIGDLFRGNHRLNDFNPKLGWSAFDPPARSGC